MSSSLSLAARCLTVVVLLIGCRSPADFRKESPDPASSSSSSDEAGSAREYAFRVGALSAWALKDSDIVVPTADMALPWSNPDLPGLLRAAGQDPAAMGLSVQPLLIRDGRRLVLIDAGTGGRMDTRGALVASLRRAGFAPADVTDVLVSHTDEDHVGGLVDASGRPTFAHATIRLSRREWEHARANAAAPGLTRLLDAVAPRLRTFEPGARLTPSIAAVSLPGHTPGHCGFEIVSGRERLLYIGDVMHSAVVSVQRPEWPNAWDQVGDGAAIATRKALLERGAAGRLRIYAVHFPFPGLGRFEGHGDAFLWEPETLD